MFDAISGVGVNNQNGQSASYQPSALESLLADMPAQGIPGLMPNEQWTDIHSAYDRQLYYYNGDVLKEKIGKDVDDPLKYPSGLNLAKAACRNHAALLIGQISGSQDVIRFKLSGDSTESGRKLLSLISDFWKLNSGDTKFMRQAVTSQIYGGVFYRIAIDPRRTVSPVIFYPLDPRSVFVIYDEYDYDRIISVDIVTQMSTLAAIARYNINPGTSANDIVTVKEHWDETEFYLTVDGELGKWPDGTPIKGKNNFFDPINGHPITPIVYIPRIRTTDFYGESLIDELRQAQDDFNTTIAHIGDGIAGAMHEHIWIRNRKNGLDGLSFDRSSVIDLGSSQIGGDSPEMGKIDGAKIDPATVDYTFDKYLSAIREFIALPNVAWGNNDGSVRSALTLHYMMFPSVNAGTHYRTNFSNGIKMLMYKIAVISDTVSAAATNAGVTNFGKLRFTEKHARKIYNSLNIVWHPMLPQDRSDLINEVVQRISTNTISVESAVAKFDGDDATKEEIKKITKEIKDGILRSSPTTTQFARGQGNIPNENNTNTAKARGGREKGDMANSPKQ